jgi:hypothetical protein
MPWTKAQDFLGDPDAQQYEVYEVLLNNSQRTNALLRADRSFEHSANSDKRIRRGDFALGYFGEEASRQFFLDHNWTVIQFGGEFDPVDIIVRSPSGREARVDCKATQRSHLWVENSRKIYHDKFAMIRNYDAIIWARPSVSVRSNPERLFMEERVELMGWSLPGDVPREPREEVWGDRKVLTHQVDLMQMRSMRTLIDWEW